MKNTVKIISLILCLVMVLGLVSCHSNQDAVTDTTAAIESSESESEGKSDVSEGTESESEDKTEDSESVSTESTSTETTSPESTSTETTSTETTESETESDIQVTELQIVENGNTASVRTVEGLSYTATGYSSVNEGSFNFSKGLEITFKDKAFASDFNRLTFKYRSTAPVKMFITYTLNGVETTEYYFLNAGEGTFRGLIEGYLSGMQGAKLKKIVVDTCESKTAEFMLYDVESEVLPVYEDDLCIENERYKIGVRLSWGGSMAYFEDKKDGIDDLGNLVNIHDTGRLIQQSFYGTRSNGEYVTGKYNGNDWPYNPVQAGDHADNGPRLIDVEVGKDYIYVVCQSLDWAKENSLTFVYYENRYTLKEDHVLVDNVATDYSGWEHLQGSQEIPAVYLISYFDTLSYYNGVNPWTYDKEGLTYISDLGTWGDTTGYYHFYKENSEIWASWITPEDNFAFGIFCPNTDRLIAIRHRYDGSKDPMANATSYVAPSSSIYMQAYKPIVYSYILATGTPEGVREVFTANKDFSANPSLSEDKVDKRVSSQKIDMTDIDFTKESNSAILCNPKDAYVSYDSEQGATKLYAMDGTDPYFLFEFEINGIDVISADDYNTLEIVYMIPETNSRTKYNARLFLCSGDVVRANEKYSVYSSLTKDGEYHTAVFFLPNSKWSGDAHKIRFDFFDGGAGDGDVMYIKSFRFVNNPEIGVDNDLTQKGAEAMLGSPKDTEVTFDETENAVKLTALGTNKDVQVELDFEGLGIETGDYTAIEIEYMLPTTNQHSEYIMGLYLWAGSYSAYDGSRYVSSTLQADGEYHTVTIKLKGATGWKGTLRRIRFDYFQVYSEEGDAIYIKSIKFVKE